MLLRGSPHFSQFQACCQSLSSSVLSILKLHGRGPYSNLRDVQIQDFIGVPFIKINTDCKETLCGEEQTLFKSKDSEHKSHQESWSPELTNICINKSDIYIDRNMGFVTANTINSDLPSSLPIDKSDTKAYLQVVDLVLRSGVPSYKGVRIPLPFSFNWNFLKANAIDYHDKALIDYIISGFPLGLNPNHTVTSNAADNHSSARDFPRDVTDFINKY